MMDVEQYYRLYGPMVLRRCRKLLADENQAEDAMHDTFVQLLRHKNRLNGKAPSSLLYVIATNICLNLIRTKSRRREDPGDDLLQRIAGIKDHEDKVIARRLLDGLFSRSRPSTRVIAVLHMLDGLTLEEVADEVGLSVSGVRKRLRSLRADLVEIEGA